MLSFAPVLAFVPWMVALRLSGLGVAAFLIGLSFVVLWANPRRSLNRVVFTCSVHVSAWVLLLYEATSGPGRVLWLRAACAVASFLPFHYAVAQQTIASGRVRPPRGLVRGYGVWFLYSLFFAADCFSSWFIPNRSTDAHRVYGPGYYAYIAAELAGYIYVIYRTGRSVRGAEGGRRVELEVWLMGCSATCLTILVTMALNALTRNPMFILLQPLIVLAFYTGTAYAITTHRVFEAGQILRLILNRLLPLLAGLAAGALLMRFLSPITAPGLDFFASVLAALLAFHGMRQWLESKFQLYSHDTAARRAILEAGRQEVRADRLERRFEEILKGWGGAERALVSSSANGSFLLAGQAFPTDGRMFETLSRLGWVTPERLAREKMSPGRAEVSQFLTAERLGVIVVAKGPTVSVLAAVGVPASRRPFSYPQVVQLAELASIFEGPLERAHIADKMQHAEQLATVGMLGASLAHEIRNPLVSLKSFVQLLPAHYHDPAFREKFFHLMSDEVKRIDRLTEQLLDLASPRAYTAQALSLNAVVKAGLELVRPRASEAQVSLSVDLVTERDSVFSDPAAVKQVLLNLCLNAIQVLEGHAGERWIRITTLAGERSLQLLVTDSGPGISPSIRNKLFQPFQSTKSSGFGLGLAICRDILGGLQAEIAADPPEPGKGATFRVTFPCPP